MAFEPVYDVAAMDGRQRLCSDQIVVEARLIPPPSVSISKILAVSAMPNISASECFTGEARYTGRVGFKVLFVDADGRNHCMDYAAEFSDKLASTEILSGMKTYFESRILDTDIVNVSASEVKLATVVEVELFACRTSRVKYLSGGGEGIYTNDERIDFCRLSAESSGTVTVTDTLTVTDATRLLMSEPRIIVLKRICGDDCVTVEGKAICDMVLDAADGMPVSRRTEASFSHQMSASGAMPSHLVVASARLASFNASFETDGETAGISVEFTIDIAAQIFASDAINPVVDAFSVTNELLTTTESVEVIRNILCTTTEDRVEGSVTLDVNMPIADNILACTAAGLHVSNVHALDDNAQVEGVVTASIIYYSAELNSKNSVSVELPFSLSVACASRQGDLITASGCVDNISVKIRRGNEFDIKADICIDLNAVEKTTRYVIAAVTLGEAVEIPDSAISIHIARTKESLWDVAKALCTTPELVLLQNPNLTLPLVGGERIITYRHLTNMQNARK